MSQRSPMKQMEGSDYEDKWSQCVKTGFTPDVTPRKSGVECGWDLASPYVVCPCLHVQWSCILIVLQGGLCMFQLLLGYPRVFFDQIPFPLDHVHVC